MPTAHPPAPGTWPRAGLLETVLGDAAAQVAVSSTQIDGGALWAQPGAVEAIFSILALRDPVAPPTINLDNPDEGCNLNYVPTAQQSEIECALSNSFGFGGTNGSLLFAKPD